RLVAGRRGGACPAGDAERPVGRACRLRTRLRGSDAPHRRGRARLSRADPRQRGAHRDLDGLVLANTDSAATVALEPALKRLQAPTLVMWADADVFFDSRSKHWLE